MKAQVVDNIPVTPSRLTSWKGPQSRDLASGFSAILERATQADAGPAPVRAAPARNRPDQGRAVLAALAMTSGPAAQEVPDAPGGMANGTTASLLARGFVKAPAPLLNRPDPAPAGAAGLQAVPLVQPVSLDLARKKTLG